MLWPRLVLLMVFNLVAGTFKSFWKMLKFGPSLLSKGISFSNVSLQGHTWERQWEWGDRFQCRRARETSPSTIVVPLTSENKENGRVSIFFPLNKLPNDEKRGLMQSKCAHKTIKKPSLDSHICSMQSTVTMWDRQCGASLAHHRASSKLLWRERPTLQPSGSWTSLHMRVTWGS